MFSFIDSSFPRLTKYKGNFEIKLISILYITNDKKYEWANKEIAKILYRSIIQCLFLAYHASIAISSFNFWDGNTYHPSTDSSLWRRNNPRARPLRVYQGVLLIAATGINCYPMTRVGNDRSSCWKNQFFSTRCNTFYFHRFYWFGIRYLLLIVNIFLTSFNFTPYLSHLSVITEIYKMDKVRFKDSSWY